jgi:sec-independent protein translocase protein TatA
MRIGPFGHWEIILILVVVLLLFGAKRLPGMAKGVGQAIREFRRAVRGTEEANEADAAAARASAPAPANAGPYVAPTETTERT